MPELFSFLSLLLNGDLEGEEDDYSALEDEEYEERFNKRITELGKKTFIPGLAKISICYIGKNIKIGQKESIIKKSVTIAPKISKYFSPNDLEEAIKICNNFYH